ncbi:MAG: hypothetical protein ACRD2M_07650 [Terriglobales bacterium]
MNPDSKQNFEIKFSPSPANPTYIYFRQSAEVPETWVDSSDAKLKKLTLVKGTVEVNPDWNWIRILNQAGDVVAAFPRDHIIAVVEKNWSN